MSKITPQQAFEAAKVLWPDATHIGKCKIDEWYIPGLSERVKVEWPVNIDRWPLPESIWRDATIQDFVDEREARFSTFEQDPRQFAAGVIAGFSRETGKWQRGSSGDWYPICQVREDVKS